MISDEQLEVAAKRYCELAELNPEDMVAVPAAPNTIPFYEPRWKRVASSLKTQWIINEALAHATRSQ